MRKNALEWWRSISSKEREEAIDKWKAIDPDRRNKRFYEAIYLSDYMIEFIYRELRTI